jgi:hypothetical protein
MLLIFSLLSLFLKKLKEANEITFLSVCTPIIARQLLGKHFPRQKVHTVGRGVFYAIRVVAK